MDSETADLPICTACGTQFDLPTPPTCHICSDPRQFIPPSGQTFTTHRTLLTTHSNTITPLTQDSSPPTFHNLVTTPKFAIGQRAILIRTAHGNILWDCLSLLTPSTITAIHALGGLAAIVISHPHYYTTHLSWAATFNCPVYVSSEDRAWHARADTYGARRFITGTREEITIGGAPTGAVAYKPGGHFPGSLVLLAHGRLLVADTLVTSPAGLGAWAGESEGRNTYSFQWSIPNMIPLSADEIAGMWAVLREVEFTSTHGAFVGTEVEDGDGKGGGRGVKGRVLDSMQIQVRRMGWGEHALLKELYTEERKGK